MSDNILKQARNNKKVAEGHVEEALSRLRWIYVEYRETHPEFASHVLSVIMTLDACHHGIAELRNHLNSL